MPKSNIKILDCTLRDGGYVIDWEFGENNIPLILKSLSYARIDYIECGYLKNCIFNPDKTLYDDTQYLEKFYTQYQNYTFMINCGEYDLRKIPINDKYENIKIRLAFKKHNQSEALNEIRELKNKGWNVFANPMVTNMYSSRELAKLTDELNNINPYGLSIVDSLGNMDEKEVITFFKFIDKLLNPELALGFHSHNNLQLSFSNAKTLLNMNIAREIIIDSCVYGMGRGAGNLCSELITKYINDNFNGQYKIQHLLKIIDKNIITFYKQKPWGYSIPYYLTALYNCHPNYAAYLVEKEFNNEMINKCLQFIQDKDKPIFNKSLIQNIIDKISIRA